VLCNYDAVGERRGEWDSVSGRGLGLKR
jgi:hypothetical protein